MHRCPANRLHHQITQYRIISHYIISHQITSYPINSNCIKSHLVASYHMTSNHTISRLITSNPIKPNYIKSHHMASNHIRSHQITSNDIISHHITSNRITSHHGTSSHFTNLCKAFQRPHVLRMSSEAVPPASGMEMQSPVFTTPWHLKLCMELEHWNSNNNQQWSSGLDVAQQDPTSTHKYPTRKSTGALPPAGISVASAAARSKPAAALAIQNPDQEQKRCKRSYV